MEECGGQFAVTTGRDPYNYIIFTVAGQTELEGRVEVCNVMEAGEDG